MYSIALSTKTSSCEKREAETVEFLRKKLQCNLISVWFQPTLTQSFENKSGKLQPIPCNVKKLYTTEVRLSNDNVSISSDILITSCWLFSARWSFVEYKKFLHYWLYQLNESIQHQTLGAVGQVSTKWGVSDDYSEAGFFCVVN